MGLSERPKSTIGFQTTGQNIGKDIVGLVTDIPKVSIFTFLNINVKCEGEVIAAVLNL